MTRIFDIKRYSIHDGPGIRITIFFKGCPLNCIWCHNPEGISSEPQRLYKEQKCIVCGACVSVCKRKALSMVQKEGRMFVDCDYSLCNACGECEDICPSLATEICGKDMSDDQILKEIEKESIFFKSSDGKGEEGGVTFCGGEPLMHYKDLICLLKKCGDLSYHRTVDTTLLSSKEIVKEVADNCDLFLVDLKHMDRDIHKKYTGVSNDQILENIKFISDYECDFYIRIPFIKGVNSDNQNITKSADFLSSLKTKPIRVELLPYHDIGKTKHERFASTYNKEGYLLEVPSEEELFSAQEIFKSYGLNVV